MPGFPLSEAAAFSTGDRILAVVLLAAALIVWPQPGVLLRRRDRRVRRQGSPVRRGAVAGLATAAAGLLLALPLWWLVMPLALVVGAVVARQQPRPTTAQVDAARADLAVTCDLLGACLQSGMAVGSALAAVVGPKARPATGGPERRAVDGQPEHRRGAAGVAAQRGPDAVVRLAGVAALLQLGADAEAAWAGAATHPDLAPIAAAARRSAVGGTGLVEALQEQAARLRLQGSARAAASAGRAGVLMAGPLGLCFLPAFLCLGLAPVVIGLLGRLDLF